MYAVTQPRHLDSQESVKAATISVLSILFCKSALPVEDLLQNAFYYYLPLHIRIMSKYSSAHMRGQGTSASLRLGTCTYLFSTTYQNRLSLHISNQKVGEQASLLLVRQSRSHLLGRASASCCILFAVIVHIIFHGLMLILTSPTLSFILSHNDRIFRWQTLLLIRIS